jgi:hypothetical protein
MEGENSLIFQGAGGVARQCQLRASRAAEDEWTGAKARHPTPGRLPVQDGRGSASKVSRCHKPFNIKAFL